MCDFFVDIYFSALHIVYMMNNKIFSKRGYIMKNNNNKMRAAEIAKNAKTAAPVVADSIASAVVEKIAPKKPTTRADVLAANAITFDAIAVNDVILFNDAMHARAKNVTSMLKYARVIERNKTRIFAIVDNAPYVFDAKICAEYAFTFAKCADDSHAVKTHEFNNTALTVRNLVNSREYFREFMNNEKIVSFVRDNKNALEIAAAKLAAKNAAN